MNPIQKALAQADKITDAQNALEALSRAGRLEIITVGPIKPNQQAKERVVALWAKGGTTVTAVACEVGVTVAEATEIINEWAEPDEVTDLHLPDGSCCVEERADTATSCPTCGSDEITVTIQSWESISYAKGVEVGTSTDRESLDFFVSASCPDYTCPSLSGSGWKDREVVDPAGNVVDNPPLFDAWSTLVEYLTR